MAGLSQILQPETTVGEAATVPKLNMALGDRTLSAPFCEQFGFGNKSVMSGKGYLSRWAIGMGIPSALIELPYPSSIADIQAKQYFAKLNAAVHAILNADSI